MGGSNDWQVANVNTLLQDVKFPTNAKIGFDTTDGNFTYSGSIGGNGGMMKIGSNSLYLTGNLSFAGQPGVLAGELFLSGSNTYGNQVWISGGTLNFTAGALVLSRTNGIVCNSGVLQWATGNTQDVSAAIDPSTNSGAQDIFDTNGNNVTFHTPMTGTAGIVKNGTAHSRWRPLTASRAQP